MEVVLGKYIDEYRKQLNIGIIQKVYRGLMDYMSGLRNYFINKYPDNYVAGNLYQGFMDITYFTLTTEFVKNKKLKIAVIFNHEKFRFEVWLVGQNKQIQKKYWEQLKETKFDKYKISDNPQDSIIDNILIEKPCFSDLDSLTKQIESGVMAFNEAIETQLSK